jgi:dihydroxyacetone kinase-like protein
MEITSASYMKYIALVARKIEADKDYITELDAATGDGDHWANLNMGFQKLLDSRTELEALPPGEMFKKIGMLIMSTVGGSSGVLYGSAYLAASKVIGQSRAIDGQMLCAILEAELAAIMSRGNAKPGFKTMIDSLSPALAAFKEALTSGADDATALGALKKGAIDGMESTRTMEAVMGRATYQTGKGVGHLDPGAVTMCYQLEILADHLTP